MKSQVKKDCDTCRSEFVGESWQTTCRECYWVLNGFSWKCRAGKTHTPDDFQMIRHGSPFGSGMWSNGQVLAEIKLIGGFEQYSYEEWDELWKLKVHHPKIIETSSSCLLCALREAKALLAKSDL